MAADSKLKKKVKGKVRSSHASLFPLWAGLLILGSPVPSLGEAGENPGELQVRVDEGLISLTSRDVPLQVVVREIAMQADLRLVQHVALDGLVSVSMQSEPLPDALDKLLANVSYQLYQAAAKDVASDVANPIPGALWVFSEGSVFAPAAMAFLEIVILQGDVREKKEAIRELQRFGTPEAVQALSVSLADEDSRVRNAAMDALSKIGGDEALAAIASAAMADDFRIRANATHALAMAGGNSSIDYLDLALHDENPIVRSAAIDSLGDIGDDRSIGVIQQALHDPDPAVRERALEVIDEINDDAAFRALFPPD